MPGGVFGLLAVAGLIWGFARVLDAPRWSGPAIGLGVVLVMLAALVALPTEAPFRQSVAGSVQTLVILGLMAVPVLGYRTVLRRLRRRAGPGAEAAEAAPQTGFVLIADDAALVADIAARAGWAAPQTFSIAHRDAAREITATGRVRLDRGLATFEGLWIAAGAAPDLLEDLVATMETEARDRRARRAAVTVEDPDMAARLALLGYARAGTIAIPAGGERVTLVRDL